MSGNSATKDVVIRAEGLGKSYRLRHQQSERYVALRDVLADKVRGLGRRLAGGAVAAEEDIEEFWALRDLSFEVRRGEVLGIIGRNGAGKSTLLKILSRITEPAEGRVRMHGRVASLLEVGTGFHPELTGRENVYLNGAILGMSRAEITRKFDEIVAFAEVEKFLDTPVKRYSSGMYVRLAFAVAAHLEPEILIVDEVLAVGDVEFQKRCLGKMKDVASSGARTVLFVSHNMAAIQALCPTALWLQDGRIAGLGDSRVQVQRYLSDALTIPASGRFSKRALSKVLSLENLWIAPNPLQSGQDARFGVRFTTTEPNRAREICLLIYSNSIGRVAILDLRRDGEGYEFGPDNPLTIVGEIRSLQLVEGEYSIGVGINCGDVNQHFLDLANLSITATNWTKPFPPYASRDRGIAELAYDFERE